MTMGWMETIRFLGLDLMVATVFAVAGLDVAACALRAAWGRIPRVAPSRGSDQSESGFSALRNGSRQAMTLCSSGPLKPGVMPVMLSSDARILAFRSSSQASSRASFCATDSVASVTSASGVS